MPRPLSDLRPCDACNGPLNAMIFHVLRISMGVINATAVRQYAGMRQFFENRASDALVLNFVPTANEGFTIAMDEDEHKSLTTELFICNKCWTCGTFDDLLMIMEKVNARKQVADVQSSDGGSSVS